MELLLSSAILVLNLFLGLVVLYRNPKSWTSILFFILTFLVNGYIVINYLSLHPPESTPESQLFWIRMVMALVALIGPNLFLLVTTFPGEKLGLARYKVIILCCLGIVTSLLAIGPFVFSSIEYPNGQPVPQPGPAMALFFIDFVGLIIASIVVLVLRYRKSSGRLRNQLRLFLFGVAATFTMMAFSTVVLTVVFQVTGYVFLGPLSIVFLLITVAYSIVRYQLLDINRLVIRSIAFSLFLLVLGALSIIAIGSLSSNLLADLPEQNAEVIIFFFGIIVALGFTRIKKWTEKATDKIFFRDTLTIQEAIDEFSAVISGTIQLNVLIEEVGTFIENAMKASSVSFVLADRSEKFWYYNPKQKLFKGSIDPILLNLQNYANVRASDHVLLFDDLSEGKIKEEMRQQNLNVVVPLKHAKKLIGCITLGQKASGDMYSYDDILALQILARQFSLAVNNSTSYEEIRQFNVTLKEEVARATSKLRAANDRLLELDRLKDEFVSLASHELRTPMVSIRNYIWMVLNGKGGTVKPKQREYLRRAYDSTSRLSRLVNSMLNLSRIESGRVILSVEQADIRKVIRDVITEIGIRADKLGVQLSLRQKVESVKTGEPVQLPSVLIDIDKIKEVLVNLIGNSLKFTPAGGTITIALAVEKEDVRVGITDTGVGLEADQIPQLFHKFTMLRDSYSSNATVAQGTGLGLYISKSIVELHRGKIWVESKGKGKGSTFYFTLPRYSEEHLQLLHKNQHNGTDAGIIHSAVTDY